MPSLYQVNETLSKLRLNGNKIDNKGGMAIAGTLQVNTMLEELDLAETDQVIMYICTRYLFEMSFSKIHR